MDDCLISFSPFAPKPKPTVDSITASTTAAATTNAPRGILRKSTMSTVEELPSSIEVATIGTSAAAIAAAHTPAPTVSEDATKTGAGEQPGAPKPPRRNLAELTERAVQNITNRARRLSVGAPTERKVLPKDQPKVVAFGLTTKVDDTIKGVRPQLTRPLGSTAKDVQELKKQFENQAKTISDLKDELSKLQAQNEECRAEYSTLLYLCDKQDVRIMKLESALLKGSGSVLGSSSNSTTPAISTRRLSPPIQTPGSSTNLLNLDSEREKEVPVSKIMEDRVSSQEHRWKSKPLDSIALKKGEDRMLPSQRLLAEFAERRKLNATIAEANPTAHASDQGTNSRNANNVLTTRDLNVSLPTKPTTTSTSATTNAIVKPEDQIIDLIRKDPDFLQRVAQLVRQDQSQRSPSTPIEHAADFDLSQPAKQTTPKAPRPSRTRSGRSAAGADLNHSHYAGGNDTFRDRSYQPPPQQQPRQQHYPGAQTMRERVTVQREYCISPGRAMRDQPLSTTIESTFRRNNDLREYIHPQQQPAALNHGHQGNYNNYLPQPRPGNNAPQDHRQPSTPRIEEVHDEDWSDDDQQPQQNNRMRADNPKSGIFGRNNEFQAPAARRRNVGEQNYRKKTVAPGVAFTEMPDAFNDENDFETTGFY